ncbi:hypothetical protein [Acidithiobacillus albertensis]|uniref:hypothetical protein n=1 Tax=Acidithiobacillus albertensis TaxID=119978 RepID=UPI00094B2222|nr:hypothetical protein [Acidithiobacillus albertensis]
MNIMNMVNDLVIIDVCLPDYFQGSSDPFLAIPLSPNMTQEDLKTAVRNAVQDDAFEDFGWPDMDYEELIQMINKRLSKYLLTRSRDIPEDTDNVDSVYAYIRMVFQGTVTDDF